ncbi:GntR family transcriptional regulator [Spiractinospora alimapuensis]|uniref:GntR family transcriptional regulator n=1 Tax=Spiractinospora alimapuensis TaxID=2820884 RepID=UPI001F403B39|nr:GntR family transcriptional regulator [Spiractinospora alimapuensis]
MPEPTSPAHTTASVSGGAPLADLLEEDIVLGRRFPRERLVEDELMEQFDVKRHVVRAALQELHNRGLVRRKPHAGAYVAAYGEKEVRDLYDLREVLEVSCARRVSLPVPRARLAELVEIQHRHDAAVGGGDARGVLQANLAFHRHLFSLADNDALVEAIDRYARMTHVIRSITITDPESLRRAQEEHWTMVDALRAGDTDLLADICRDHLRPSRDAYLRRVRTA